MRVRHREIIMAACTILAPGIVKAADAQELTPQPATAHRITSAMTFDGRLDEDDWRDAPALDRFYENFPGERLPAPEHTEARFLYDDRYLYVGFRGHLKDPAGLRKPFVRRDKVNSSHDYIQVYLDPQGTGRSSYLFRVNARGVKTDGLQDEAKQTESTDPDFDWDVRTAIAGEGWTAELRIPLATLRVSRHGAQVWRVIVTRGVPRGQNTQMATAPFPHDGSCFLCLASKLTFADLEPHAEKFIIEPSAVASVRHDTGSYGNDTRAGFKPSLDAKWLPYGGAAVDITIKPDFSQVEADSPQLTSNERFAINLPEKRPFFRESSDLIGTALPVLYTRTITAPDYGIRFTHRSSSVNGTAFFAEDGGRGGIIEPGLLSSSLGLPDFDSRVGFAHVTDGFGRVLTGALGAAKVNADGSFNVLGGADFAWQSNADRVVGQILYSSTRNPNRPDLLPHWTGQSMGGVALLAQWDHNAGLVWSLSYTRYDPGFRSWLGYVPRVGYQQYHAYLQKPVYFASPLVNTLSPYISYDRLDAVHAHGQETNTAIGVNVGGLRGLNLDMSLHPRIDVLTESGQQRRTSDFEWTGSITPGRRIPVFTFNGNVGRRVDFATGEVVDGATYTTSLRTRPLDRVELEGRYSVLRLGDAPQGGDRLRETIRELLATWYFGPAFYVLADAQFFRTVRRYPDATRESSSLISLQFSWEMSSGWRSFFGVRSGAVQPEATDDRGRSTELYFKLSKQFRI